MFFTILSLVFFFIACLFAWMWWRNAGEYFSKFRNQQDTLNKYAMQICDQQGEIYLMAELGRKAFPYDVYQVIKHNLFYFQDAVEHAPNLDVVQEAQEYLDMMTEKEKEIFEFEYDGLSKLIYQAKNKFCSYCQGHGVITSEVEIGGRIIDGDSPCKYCNGSGQF